ncbi:MAG TPA: hypothetical protein PLG54_09220 [Bacteroidales bacterium]|jgi:DNA polymerase-3 subunit delta'|nr:hypothetical protein [Bacteroidales bacterium]HOE59910.1 hypothetical protein [Bacteroidales bacterium]HOR05678.1 hypothetical protein [Bacteroidales bacterium]HOU35500.1 hypothetical protein [Bacteroidales bacterium]HPL34813.1 hypothetical protein [Bacteroidales bacterium]
MYFRDIPGMDVLKGKLIESVNNKRISHTQLFFGPEGSASLGLAIAYGRYIQCRQPIHNDACGKCPSCLKYNKLQHPDLHFIFPVAKKGKSSDTEEDEIVGKTGDEPSSLDFMREWREFILSNKALVSYKEWLDFAGLGKRALIYTRDTREIFKRLNYKSYESEYKILIIWYPEKFFHSASHRLLKALEEPPEKTVFILVSENKDEILPTILSRCQSTFVPPFTQNELKQALQNNLHLPEDQALHYASVADGNFIVARQLANENSDFHNYFDFFANWFRYCYNLKYKPKKSEAKEAPYFVDALKIFESLGQEGQKQFLRFGIQLLRNSLFFSMDTSQLVKLEGEEQLFARNFSPFIHSRNIALYSDAFGKAIMALERNSSPNMVFTNLTMSIHQLITLAKAKSVS